MVQVALQTLQGSKDTRVKLILRIFPIQILRFFFSCPQVSSKFWEKKILNPDTNSHNLQAATNTVAPLLTFYKDFIWKNQALGFQLYNSLTSPVSLQNYAESTYHLKRPKPCFSYSLWKLDSLSWTQCLHLSNLTLHILLYRSYWTLHSSYNCFSFNKHFTGFRLHSLSLHV